VLPAACFVVSAVLAATSVAAFQVATQDWPQLLGPAGNGAIDTVIAPTARLAEAWRKPIGSGTAAVVVSAGRAFTLFTDETDDYLIAFAAPSGRELWRSKIAKTHNDALTSGPVSTPAVAGDLVFGFGSSCRLVAVRASDGTPAWDVDVAAAYKSRFANRGGCGISPIVHGNVVVLPTGAPEGDRLVAFDRATGKQVWTAKSAERSINTTPSYWTAGGSTQLLYHYVKPPGRSGIAGVDLKDGSILWSVDSESGMSNTPPLPLPSGRVLLQMWSGSAVYEAAKDGAPRAVWSNNELSAGPVPAVYVDGHLYGFGGNSNEFFRCVEAATGKARWSSRIYRGNAVAAGKTLVLQSESSGLLRLIAADPAAYREIARIQSLRPGAATFTPPTIADGRVFVRNREEIVAIAIR
jgi:outer membrane protein assembly factor BamB